MTYNLEAIGNRIRHERENFPNGKKKGISQGELAQKLGYSAEYRQLVANWESSTKLPSLEDSLKLCDLFSCEMGYLLCQPDYVLKTGRKTDIQKATGLSKEAIDALESFADSASESMPNVFRTGYIISLILQNPSFYGIIREMLSSVYNQMILEKANMEKTFLSTKIEQEYFEEIAGIKETTVRLNDLMNNYGYAMVEVGELLKMLEFRINQEMGNLIHETIDYLHDESLIHLKRMAQESGLQIQSEKTATKPTPAP